MNFPILISHRGNLTGKQPHKENHPNYITEAFIAGYDVEVDVWVKDGSLFLGHDEPQYEVSQKFLENKHFWLHAKNSEALNYFIKHGYGMNYFWHDNDDYTLTSKGYVWAYPGKSIITNTIAVLPERDSISAFTMMKDKVTGICSDVIEDYKQLWRETKLNNPGMDLEIVLT